MVQVEARVDVSYVRRTSSRSTQKGAPSTPSGLELGGLEVGGLEVHGGMVDGMATTVSRNKSTCTSGTRVYFRHRWPLADTHDGTQSTEHS